MKSYSGFRREARNEWRKVKLSAFRSLDGNKSSFLFVFDFIYLFYFLEARQQQELEYE